MEGCNSGRYRFVSQLVKRKFMSAPKLYPLAPSDACDQFVPCEFDDAGRIRNDREECFSELADILLEDLRVDRGVRAMGQLVAEFKLAII